MAGAAAEGTTYRAGVVGAGSGGTLSMRALAASPRYELVAVADLSEEARRRAKDAYPEVRTYATHGEMLASCALDVVCVSTWPPYHLSVTRDALAHPLRGILVEKPLADNWRDGRQVLQAVRARGLPLAVPHGLLVAAHVGQIVERVQGGEIGRLELIEIQCAGWDIINAGIHWLNFVVVVTGGEPFGWVMASCDKRTRTYRDRMQVETTAVTYAQSQSGVRVVMHTGDDVVVSRTGKGTLFRLVGTGGLLEFYAWEPRYWLLNGAHPRGRTFDVDPGPRSAHQRHLEALAGQIDRGEPDYGVAESSLAALELCDAAYLSCRHGCKVTLPLSAFVAPEPTDWDPGAPYSGEGGGRDGRKLS
ncbi:MAG: Gfo/Idh/MocA family oxidoreductase [Anaerolineae bacterium]|nr:Gfo/Idh/MocA family oxidoreductase [Anaerolineae bacterium]